MDFQGALRKKHLSDKILAQVGMFRVNNTFLVQASRNTYIPSASCVSEEVATAWLAGVRKRQAVDMNKLLRNPEFG